MRAASAPDAGRPFEPAPRSQPLYGIRAPEEDPARQRHFVRGADGVELFVEAWLPARNGRRRPPSRIPTVVLATPYARQGEPRNSDDGLLEAIVPAGYAFAQVHVRGTGESGGCLEFIGPREADDLARVIEYVGRDAPWSDGKVAGIGISYDGGAMIAAAGGGDPSRTKYLKAIVTLAPAATLYDLGYFDGVPHLGADAASSPIFTALFSAPPAHDLRPDVHAQRGDCQPRVMLGSVNPDGDFTAFAAEREWRRRAARIRAATLMVHGHADSANMPVIQAGLFDRLHPRTPKAALIGVFGHEFPHRHATGVRREWERSDFWPMVRAWLDEHVRGRGTGAAAWPRVQVQGSDGQWRAEPDWPGTGGPAGHLALGPAGRLGTTGSPSGETSYVEGAPEIGGSASVPGTAAVFETDRLPDRLEITGQPMLDMWVSLDKPDAHLAARIEALDANGEPIPHARSLGFRSLQHLDPLEENRFVQPRGKPAPVNAPIRVPLRFNPTDVVVPRGGSLRLTVAGSLDALDPLLLATGVDGPVKDPSQPSGSATQVTIHHDCERPAALRFVMPRRAPDLLNVREADEPAGTPLADNRRAPAPRSDAGGLASATVCGQPPLWLPQFGPVTAAAR